MWPTTAPDPAHNAVPLLTQAMAAAAAVNSAGIDSPSQSTLEYPDYPPYPLAWHKLADAAMAAPGNQKAMALVRRARRMGEIDGKIKLPVGALGTAAPSLNNARNLANLLEDAALHAHLHGDDLEALRRLRDAFFLARAVDQQHTLISHLVAIGIGSMTTWRLMTMAPDLTLSTARNSSAARKEVMAIIAHLLDDRDAELSLRNAFAGERAMQIKTLQRSTAMVWLIRPMYELELARLLKADRGLMLAATRPSYSQAETVLQSLALPPVDTGVFATRSPASPPRFSHEVSRIWLEGLGRIEQVDVRTRNNRRMAAISLAIAMYRADHDGQFPASLTQLVPTYLPSIPRDLFASDNRPIEYIVLKHALPDGRDRPLLHSVGPDGRDDYAAGKQHPPREPCFSWDVSANPMDDQFRDLARWAPSAATLPIR